MTHSRNRNATGRRLATGCFALLLSLPASQRVLADIDDNAFRMMVMLESGQGYLVTRGRYDQAIKRITRTAPDKYAFSAHNNLCVAYTKTMQFDKAKVSCDQAIDASPRVRSPLGWNAAAVASSQETNRAIALSNRGVLRSVTGDNAGARRDFMASLSLRPGFNELQHNVTHFESRAKTSVTTAQHAR